MKLSRLAVLATTLCLSACSAGNSDDSGQAVRGSGKLAAESRQLGAYHALELDLPADLGVEIGADGDVSIRTDDNLLPLIKTKVESGTLQISSDKSLNDMSSLTLGLKTKMLDHLALRGAARVTVLNMSGGNLEITSDGASTIEVSGSVDNFKVTLTGAGRLRARNLVAKSASINITGAGDAELDVVDKLDASITGAGTIRYKGDPKLTQQVVGAGTVLKL